MNKAHQLIISTSGLEEDEVLALVNRIERMLDVDELRNNIEPQADGDIVTIETN
jgi:hypothetical protein